MKSVWDPSVTGRAAGERIAAAVLLIAATSPTLAGRRRALKK
jgi:hypothetical protein